MTKRDLNHFRAGESTRDRTTDHLMHRPPCGDASSGESALGRPQPLGVPLILRLQRTAGNQVVRAILDVRKTASRYTTAGHVVQRSWLDDQVELVRQPLEHSDEDNAVKVLNGYSFDDIRRIIAALSTSDRKRLKSILPDFIGKYDVERIRTCIAVVEGGGPPQLAATTEKVHHMMRGNMWGEVYQYLFVDVTDLIRQKVLNRLSSGHLKVLLENLSVRTVSDRTLRGKIRKGLHNEAEQRAGFLVSEGRDFREPKKGKEAEGNEPINVLSPSSPEGNLVSLLIEGPEDAQYKLALNTWNEGSLDPVGHAWIEVEETSWPMRKFSFGFWPEGANGGGSSAQSKAGFTMISGMKGALRSPDPHKGQELTSRVKVGTRKEIHALQTVVEGYAGKKYSLFGDNCAAFATHAWMAMTGDNANVDDWFFTSPSDIADKSRPPATPED